MVLKTYSELHLTDLITLNTFEVKPTDLVIVKNDTIQKAKISAFDQHYIDLYHVVSLDEVPTLRRIHIEEVQFQLNFDVLSPDNYQNNNKKGGK